MTKCKIDPNCNSSLILCDIINIIILNFHTSLHYILFINSKKIQARITFYFL